MENIGVLKYGIEKYKQNVWRIEKYRQNVWRIEKYRQDLWRIEKNGLKNNECRTEGPHSEPCILDLIQQHYNIFSFFGTWMKVIYGNIYWEEYACWFWGYHVKCLRKTEICMKKCFHNAKVNTWTGKSIQLWDIPSIGWRGRSLFCCEWR